MTEVALPPAFAELEDVAAIWALPTENARSAVRWQATKAQFQALYDAVWPRLGELMAHVDKYQLGAMPPAEARLLHLLLAFAESSLHVELYKGDNQVPISFENSRLKAHHGDVDCA